MNATAPPGRFQAGTTQARDAPGLAGRRPPPGVEGAAELRWAVSATANRFNQLEVTAGEGGYRIPAGQPGESV